MERTESTDSIADTVTQVSRNWWVLLLQGVLSIIFGLVAIFWPGTTLAVVIWLFGLFVLVTSVVGVFAAIGAAGNHEPWGWRLTAALFGVLVGLLILRWPGVTAGILLLLIGVWAIVAGLGAIVAAVADHNEIAHAWLYVLLGAVMAIFGIAMFVWPAAGLATVVYLVAAFAIVTGIIYCVIAFQVRTLPHQLQAMAQDNVPPGALPST
jgi:uncharacterized membrane protein HdeD (DUF308 family)